MTRITTDLEELQAKLLDSLIRNSELEDKIKQLEAEVKKLKSKPSTPVTASKEILMQADSVYGEYPLKKGRKAAIASIIKALKVVDYETLFFKTQEYCKARKVNGKTVEYTMNPTTWYNQECWLDDPETWIPKQQNNTSRPTQSYGNFI